VFWDLLKGFIGRGEDGVVCLRAVKKLDYVVVLVDELCKLGSVLALVDELSVVLVCCLPHGDVWQTHLVDCSVRLVIMWRVMRLAVMWRAMVRRVVRMIMILLEINNGVIKR
jgi:hypothetical protein